MPKYYEFKIAGYYLYFTSFCTVECMHVHASDRKLTEAGSAKFFVKDNGDTVLQNQGRLTDREVSKIQGFIKDNYKAMYMKWSEYSRKGYYKEIIKDNLSIPNPDRKKQLLVWTFSFQRNLPLRTSRTFILISIPTLLTFCS